MRTAEVDLARVTWRKASYSNGANGCVEVGVWRTSGYSVNGSNCIEVGAWAKSSHSGNGADCVEATAVADGTAGAGLQVLLRDSKDRDGGVLTFDSAEWRAFIAGVKDGDFDLA